MSKYALVLVLVVIPLLAACGRASIAPPEPTPQPTIESLAALVPEGGAEAAVETVAANPENGEQLFNAMQQSLGYACSSCHNVANDARLVGPSLLGIPERAGERVEGQSAEEYLHNSIVHPNDHIVEADPPYPENLMPQNYEEVFTEQEINDIVAYLLELPTS